MLGHTGGYVRSEIRIRQVTIAYQCTKSPVSIPSPSSLACASVKPWATVPILIKLAAQSTDDLEPRQAECMKSISSVSAVKIAAKLSSELNRYQCQNVTFPTVKPHSFCTRIAPNGANFPCSFQDPGNLHQRVLPLETETLISTTTDEYLICNHLIII